MEEPEFYYVRTRSPSGQYFVVCYDPDRRRHYSVKVAGKDFLAKGCCTFKIQQDAVRVIYSLDMEDCPSNYETAVVPYYKEKADPEIVHEKVHKKNFEGAMRKIAKGHQKGQSKRVSTKKAKKAKKAKK